MTLPIATIKRILSNHGTIRVSNDAAMEMEKVLATFAEEISIDAKKLALHAGRRTIRREDVELATQ